MPDSYFTLMSAVADGDRLRQVFRAGEATTGPWAAHLQHGGPPNALAVDVAEQVVREATGRTDLRAMRLACDFVGPVPLGEIVVSARIVRTARSAALAEVVVEAGGRECLHVRVWFIADTDTAGLAPALPPPLGVPEPASGLDASFPYGASLEWRFVDGAMRRKGPGSVWVRPRTSLHDGHEMSGLSRVVLIADSASGVSAELDWSEWSFVNVDLDVHLARPVEGEWVLLDAATQLGGHGSALARSTISDMRGVVGSGAQTLVLTPLRRPSSGSTPTTQPG